MDIPIIIICYNNYQYVKNTLSQILRINKNYYKDIIILNNASTCLYTIEYLKNLVDVNVINHKGNFGPWISLDNNKHIYDVLPNKFILTDPDLKFNKNIPSNFIEILSNLSEKYKTSKIGFALDISDHEKFHITTDYWGVNFNTLYDGEKGYWENKIEDDEYELYVAGIDTTFSLINKDNIANGSELDIRIAGNFTAKHIPWYKENEIYNVYDNYYNCYNTTIISSFAKIIISNIKNNYLQIYKNDEMFFIENNKNNKYLPFWKDIYNEWENEMFEIFDKYLSNDKIFIDIGGGVAACSMYASRKSKYVYAIEADINLFNDMTNNMKANCANNYNLINKAIYNIDNAELIIYKKDYTFYIETITLETIIKNYDIDISNISLIKVDIEGGEENILNTLYDIHIKYNISIYISIYYSLWNDKNLDKFLYLSEYNKNIIATSAKSFIFLFF
jgi:FkbM family methyltransferase